MKHLRKATGPLPWFGELDQLVVQFLVDILIGLERWKTEKASG
jgi:hypothetical protein